MKKPTTEQRLQAKRLASTTLEVIDLGSHGLRLSAESELLIEARKLVEGYLSALDELNASAQGRLVETVEYEHYSAMATKDEFGAGVSKAPKPKIRTRKPRAAALVEKELASREHLVVEKAQELRKVARADGKHWADPKYSNVEFKCIQDYDTCINERGYGVLCALALMICVGRRMIPFVKP